ncbi:MAG TPA: hypothetical protein VES62_15570, partial [Thermoleophilaceae bacterium]|nr:hypothetical protein [Thermoleophilaceae bacterium]
QVLSIRLLETNLCVTPPGERHHFVGDVHTPHDRPALNRPEGCVPRSRSHVQGARAGPDCGRVQQGLNEPRGDPAGEQAVALGLVTPAGALECFERLGRQLPFA